MTLPNLPRLPTPDEIIDAACDAAGVTLSDLTGPTKAGEVALCRTVVVHLLHTRLRRGPAAIGRALGNRDHTTAIYYRHRASGFVEVGDRRFNDLLAESQRRIEEAITLAKEPA